jgi:hypothetical protein
VGMLKKMLENIFDVWYTVTCTIFVLFAH